MASVGELIFICRWRLRIPLQTLACVSLEWYPEALARRRLLVTDACLILRIPWDRMNPESAKVVELMLHLPRWLQHTGARHRLFEPTKMLVAGNPVLVAADNFLPCKNDQVMVRVVDYFHERHLPLLTNLPDGDKTALQSLGESDVDGRIVIDQRC
jgi:hypothetical protein